jgi:hypothetical protein
MARARARSRRSRDEDDEDDRSSRRGGRSSGRKSGPPPAILAAGVGLVVVAGIVAWIASSGGKPKEKEPVKALAPAPPPKAPEPAKPVLPVKVPPKPLTPEERAYIDGLFQKAEPHFKAFEAKVKEGWALKEKGDNDGSNAAWVTAKDEAHIAIQIVVEAIEDEDRFPPDRQDAYMGSWVSRLARWQKALADVPKVNVDR